MPRLCGLQNAEKIRIILVFRQQLFHFFRVIQIAFLNPPLVQLLLPVGQSQSFLVRQ